MAKTAFDKQRANMVENQLRPNYVTDDRLLDAFGRIPRHEFLPESKQAAAYVDEDVEIADGRYLMAPHILGRMIQAADVKPTDHVMAVGVASGYPAAILSELSGDVVAVEQDDVLRQWASDRLPQSNVTVVDNDHPQGYPDHGPYDRIIICGAVDRRPDRLCEQLAPGGNMTYITRDAAGDGDLVCAMKSQDGHVSTKAMLCCSVPFLAGFEPQVEFTF
jgi:protein-L-isoaspartate(D-aspartate) O-methyltransferase